MQVLLTEEQAASLKQYVFEITKNGIDEARKSANLDKPFLKQKYCAEWLGISVNTLKTWERQGLPSIMIDGVKLFSKKDTTKWVMKHQN
ncbi:MAG: hypothetical protein ACTH54_09530 [Vagococcus salmoninarum]|uniref:hypothetical protein n=1 Tax=Vagococcus salmoninarum TaxID=2739 RepID=UPI003F98FD14